MSYTGYDSLLILFLVTGAFGFIFFFLSEICGPKNPIPSKMTPFECGHNSAGTQGISVAVKFLVIAIIFVAFDVEIIFIYPWAVVVRDRGWFALIELLIFIGVLFLGLVYIWRKGGLEWEK